MTPLGRGLASLIPRRQPQEADDMLSQIDSVEEFEGEAPKIVKELRRQQEDEISNEKKMEVIEESEEPEVEKAPKRLNIMEEPEEDMVEIEDDEDIFAQIEKDEDEETDKEEVDEDDAEEDDEEEDEDADVELEEEEAEADEEAVSDEAEEGESQAQDEEDADDEPEDDDLLDDEEEEVANGEEKEVAKIAEAPFAPRPFIEDEAGEVKHLLGEKVEYIAVGDIAVNPLQPRYRFDDHELEELKQSIDQHGLLQPLVVNIRDDGSYQLVAGERRLRAVKLLAWKEVPCVVRSDVAGDRNRLELALIENVQRSNLNPIEEAMGYQRLNEEYGMTHEEIGGRVGRSRVGITNIIRVLQLPAEIQRGLIEGKISIGHARAILMIPDEEKQIRFYHHVVDEGLTVRKAENRARRIQRTMKLNDPLRQKTRGRAPLAMKYDGALQDRFGYNARVKFDNTKNRYEVVFHAFSETEAEDLIKKLLSGEGQSAALDEDVIES